MIIYTVTQLNRYISFKIKEDRKLQGAMIKGEITNFKAHRSGHFYFSLKDNESSVKAVMFKSYASSLKFLPEDGMSVIVLASADIYERDGTFQINVNDIQPAGAGAAAVALEQLKSRLSKEGIFKEENKRKLPYLPKKIGVVTSGSGAAVHDIINVLQRRYPIGEIYLFSAAVQGEKAVSSICEGLASAQQCGCDVVIVGRGGGAAEDLKAFNSEQIAYCIYNCTVPVISAVGHETDYTIADMVADVRAATPSAAAEIAAPSKESLLNRISFIEKQIKIAADRIIMQNETNLNAKSEKLKRFSPEYKLQLSEKKLNILNDKLNSIINDEIIKRENLLVKYILGLKALSPLNVMCRGYSLVYKDKKIITDSNSLKVNDEIHVKLFNGSLNARVLEKGEQ